MKINVKRIGDTRLPERGTTGSAGYDLYCPITVSINPGECVRIPSGFACEIPEGFFGAIYARSSLMTKGLRLAGGVSIIDSDYRGEIHVPLFNDSKLAITLNKGDRYAQLIIQAYQPITWNEVNELSETIRGNGGFGSTGS